MPIDIPNVPGVPALLSYASQASVGGVLTTDTLTGYGAGNTPKWGLYKGGSPAITAESVVAFGFRIEWSIASYPIERGGFESYDRVATPFQGRLQFASGKNDETRRALLDSLAAASKDGNMTKYDVVTPDFTYASVSVSHYDYDRRAERGAGLLMIDVWLQEIREQNTGNGTTAQEPSGQAPQTGGTVQPSDVPLPEANPLRGSAGGGLVPSVAT